MPQLVLGTAGHIDHGKSALVRALTGIDPDRLPEEKARGMTIDLGFAHTRAGDADLYFVDVPGHERFIRNMVAGATGIDVALLVVAADDAVMPQTREHAELLMLLGVTRCVIILTKMDLVDDAWADAVDLDVRNLLQPLGIVPLTTVRTSVVAGRGLDELRTLLERLAHDQTRSNAAAPTWFRMPIDRVFSVAGRGTVVTGSVWHGGLAAGEELELLPAGKLIRVRDLQTHNDPRAAATGRMRLAINLANVARDEVARGGELVTPGVIGATTRFDAAVTLLRMPGRTTRTLLRARLHTATSEVLAQVRLFRTNGGETAESASDPALFAQLRLAEPIACFWGQRFALRDESGERTLGGGQVVNPLARPWSAKSPPTMESLQLLRTGTPLERVAEITRLAEWDQISDAALVGRAGLTAVAEAQETRAALARAGRLIALADVGLHAYVHSTHVDALATLMDARLTQGLRDNPRWTGVPRTQWAGWMPRACPEKLRPLLAEHLIATQRVSLVGGFVVPRSQRSDLPPADQALFDAILREFADGGYQPPTLATLKCVTPRNVTRVEELIGLATARGRLVRVADGFWLHADRWRDAANALANAIRTRGPLKVADIRTLLQSSRKFIVPLCEAFDAAGITKRSGDTRGLGPKAPAA